MKIRRGIAVIICVLILVANVSGLIMFHQVHSKNLMYARNRVLSSADFNCSKERMLEIGGVWECYPDKLIIPKSNEDLLKEKNDIGRESGILHGIKIGTADEIGKKRDMDQPIEFFVISCCLIVGLCLTGSSLWRKDLKNLRYFGLFLILQGVYISTIGEKIIGDILSFPTDNMVFYEFQIQIMYLSFFCLLLLIHHQFTEYSIEKSVRWLSILLLLVGTYFNWVPFGSVFNLRLSIYQHKLIITTIIAGTLSFIIFVLFRAILNGVSHTGYIIILSMLYVCYLSALLLNFIFRINVGKIPIVIMLLMILMQVAFMYYRSRIAFCKVDQLSKQLLTYDGMKDSFLAKTSMELQKPAANIRDLSETLLKGEKGYLNFYQQQDIMQVNREVKHIFGILDEMLEASGENQNIKVLMEDISSEMLAGMIEELEYLVYDRVNLRIQKYIPDDFPGIRADKQKLRRILYHLIQNAVKFTENGEIIVSAEVKGEEAFISVKDTGEGIAKSQRDIIFVPFYQGKKQKGDESEGFGLGLGITKNFVELMGGRIWVVSEIGKGSQFIFSLRLVEKEVVKALQNSAPAKIIVYKDPKKIPEEYVRLNGLKEETILIVLEDEEDSQKLRRLNQDEKYTLFVFRSYETVPEFILSEKVDLIILDLNRGNAVGYETCKRIREYYTMAELPVIILTKTGEAKELQKSVQAGINDFMRKPFSWEELKVRIETLLLVKNSAKEAINQEYKKLHTQIMPHFLYNTMNTIIGLSYRDTGQACEALQYLSIYFRAKLDFGSYNSFVSIEREIELMKAYLSIEKMRYQERLTVIYDLDESLDFELPALTLQPLVENAVQHGMADNRRITIMVSMKLTAEQGIVIQVKDDGPGIPKEKQKELLAEKNHRIGFSNVLRKIRLMKNAELILDSNEDNGTCITIHIKTGNFHKDNFTRCEVFHESIFGR